MKHMKSFMIYILEILAGIAINGLAFLGLAEDPSVLTGIGSGILAVG